MTATVAMPARAFVDPAQELDTPCMVIDEAALHQNIAEMAAWAKSIGVAMRPHIKTHKTPEIAKLQLAAGAIGITCAKLGEAEVMAGAGIEDILIGHEIVGAPKIRRLLALMERARVIVGVDSHEGAEALSAAMASAERTLDVYIEVDTGHRRAGVPAGEPACRLALDVARLPGLRVIGLFTHEGHANAAPPDQIEEIARAAGRAMAETAERIRSQGLDIEAVSVGSTPAAAYTPTVPGITEMRPGTYVFRDASGLRYGIYGPDRCAARIVATVVSRPAPDRAVLDAGSKVLALDKTPSHPGHGYIVGHERAIIDRLSEEHGVVIVPPDETGLRVGDRVEIIPNHVCPTVNLTDELLVLRDGRVTDVWKVAARGKVR
jgi:D-serine deaminase-like pyridoxal phosphate-dependent protein